MYDHTISLCGKDKNLKGKTLVEVCCGRGGCFKFMVDEYKPARAIGIDQSVENLVFCKRTLGDDPHMQFVEGDAMRLQEVKELSMGMADFIVCVEASHCFPDMDAFFKSVVYLLKNDGCFAYADFRPHE